MLNNSFALSSSLRAKGCNRSYLASLGLVFKLVWTQLNFQYGTKFAPLQKLLQAPSLPLPHLSGHTVCSHSLCSAGLVASSAAVISSHTTPATSSSPTVFFSHTIPAPVSNSSLANAVIIRPILKHVTYFQA